MPDKSIFPESSSHIPVHISEQATEWYVRLQADDVTAQDFSEFHLWLHANPQHQEAWHCLEQFGLSLEHIKYPLLPQALSAIDQKVPHSLFTVKSIIWTIVFGGCIFAGLNVQQQQLWQQWQADYKTKIGEQKSIQLADGSQIILNTDTAININYNHKKREIELIKGEIHLEVVKDQSQRPFSVTNRDGVMQDIGTTFNIRQYDKHTVLAVSEGEVRVTTQKSHKSISLHAEQQVLFDQHIIHSIQPLNTKYSTWTNGVFNVYKMPLSEFIIELDRYHKGRLSYEGIDQLEVSGVFPMQDSEKVLHSLEQQLPITVESRLYYWKIVTLNKK